jgi:hypothetical protein
MAPAPTSDISWTLPVGWKQLPGDGQLRFATIQTDGQPPLSISVVRLNGPGGRSLVMNINRWEGQLKLPPTAEADLGKLVTTLQTAGGMVHLVELTGPAGDQQERIVGALFFTDNDSWSFLLRGQAKQVTAAEDQFKALVSSIQQTTTAAPSVADATPASASSPTDLAHAAGLTAWTTPSGWEIEQPTSAMRVASFRVGASEVVISRFPQAAMNDRLMNLNRWRGQVQLQPTDNVDGDPPTKTVVGGIDSELYDFAGPTSANGEAHHLLVAVAPQADSFWFFKFLGPASEITAQKPAFDAFLKSVQLGGAQ